MRIVIDLQGAQGGSRYRGIGRYSLAFAEAIVRNRGRHEVLLAVNGLFTESVESIRGEFTSILPQENICAWYAPGPVSGQSIENDWHRKSAELVREAFIASLKPDMVVVTNLFDGLDSDAVSSVGLLSRNIPTAAILYDLIPLIYPDSYLKNSLAKSWYEEKLAHLRRADLLMAISECSRDDGIRYLGLPNDVVVNISTASDPQFQPQSISAEHEAKLRERYSLHKAYVMYTGGMDNRKNIESLIRAYARLPGELRAEHQLAVVCALGPGDKLRLEVLARKCMLKRGEVVLTGFVQENDLPALYQLCKLFVFPSRYEGFGLPALEAMSCGKAVIGSNTSSLPEVIGRDDALFDPENDEAISEKLKQALLDDAFRGELEQHGLKQARKFTWGQVARRAIAAFESWHDSHHVYDVSNRKPDSRPRLAYVSPLPPERSGISDYSAELLPELSRYYNIDVIISRDSVSDSWVNSNCRIRDVEWFRSHAGLYDRVLYHFGNSDFHQHMFALLEEVPGVVVLHDFFLSGVVAHMGIYGEIPGFMESELYSAHGYHAVHERFHTKTLEAIVHKYPCNLEVLRRAQGIIVHSEYSRRLAVQWYRGNESDNWAVIPLLRAPVISCDRVQARQALKIEEDAFVVCSFGLLDPSKLNHRIIESWLSSGLAKDNNCILVFVGANNGASYTRELVTTIKKNGSGKRIHITGWVDEKVFGHYLAAADIGIQLRAHSRGETSAAVLDCMNYGLPTIVNANGSLADLPDDAVWKLPDNFIDTQLIEAMETLWHDRELGHNLGKRAREEVYEKHMPGSCAEQYFSAIEVAHRRSAADIPQLTRALGSIEPAPADADSLLALAEAVAQSIPPRYAPRQLLVDVSDLLEDESSTSALQPVTSILHEWLKTPPEGMRVEPVYATKAQGYRYARHFTLGLLDCPADVLDDEPVEYRNGDIYLGLKVQPAIVCAHQEFYQQMRRQGVAIQFVIYEMSYSGMAQYFSEGAEGDCRRWWDVVAESDGAICTSSAVANELDALVNEHGRERRRPFKAAGFHLDADTCGDAHLNAKCLLDIILNNKATHHG